MEYRKALQHLNTTNAITKIMDAWHIIGREKAKIAVDWTKEFFAQSEDNVKLVLYAHHLDVIKILEEGLRPYGNTTIHGTITPKKRNDRVKSFQKGLQTRVLIINKSGGEGIDLFGIGNVDASTILFVERQWTPALEWQAEGRLDRIGQTSPVVAYYLSAIGTFDTHMAKEIDSKRHIMDSVMEIEDVKLDVRKAMINSLL